MSNLSEFTELKNDGACEFYETAEARIKANEAIQCMTLTCPNCGKLALYDKDNTYHCHHCNTDFASEKFILE